MSRLKFNQMRVAGTTVLVIVVVLTAGQVWLHDTAQHNVQTAVTDQRNKLAGSVDDLRTQVTYCHAHPRGAYCQRPAAPPPQQTISSVPVKPAPIIGAPGIQGPPGRQGPPGPAPAMTQIADAVAAYLRAHPPPAGRQPTMAEILTAVTQYLAANPPSAGPQGPAGPAGQNGSNGTNGNDGQNGTTGRGITSVEYTDQCHVTVTYTDGSQQQITIANCPPPLVATPSPGG